MKSSELTERKARCESGEAVIWIGGIAWWDDRRIREGIPTSGTPTPGVRKGT